MDGFSSTEDGERTGRVLTQGAHSSTVEADVGQTLVLELEENPSTGYLWHVEVTPGIERVSEDYAPRSKAGIGGAGLRRFIFRVARPGESQVRARLQRPWLGEGSAISRCDFTIWAR